jgi:hypothetical protein
MTPKRLHGPYRKGLEMYRRDDGVNFCHFAYLIVKTEKKPHPIRCSLYILLYADMRSQLRGFLKNLLQCKMHFTHKCSYITRNEWRELVTW